MTPAESAEAAHRRLVEARRRAFHLLVECWREGLKDQSLPKSDGISK